MITMAKKKKRVLKKPSKKKRFDFDLDPEVSKGIWSIVLVAFAILSMLSFLNRAGTFGVFSHSKNKS